MVIPVQIYVFGDQTYDVGDLLSQLLHTYDDANLCDFLERSCTALKREVSRLEPHQQAHCPRFAKLTDLLPHWKAGTLNPALSQAITCICQLGSCLLEHGAIGTVSFPSPQTACLTGLCTGSLSAAAMSCASNPSELLWLAIPTVVVAFRLGALAWDVGSRLSSHSPDASMRYPSWTAALANTHGEDIEAAIEHFASQKKVAKVATPYISAYITPNQLSISGPPHALEEFLDAHAVIRRSATRLSIFGPYHGSHLYDHEDVARIVSNVTESSQLWPDQRFPLVSTTSGQTLVGQSFPELLSNVVQECLLSPIRWDLLPDAIASFIRSRETGPFTFRPVATSPDRLQQAVYRSLGLSQDSLASFVGPTIGRGLSNASPAKSKIAVLSMSGRFPHASSMDAFWNDVLIDGFDAHELVPAWRWNPRTHVDPNPTSKNVSGTGFGCWLHDAAEFDARFFNMSPREAPQVDPAQRLALLTAGEALEQAGLVPGRSPSSQKDRVGVYFGSTSNDWMETNSAQNIDTYFIPGGNRAFIPGRINYHYKFSGPSYTIDTACSSSLAAMHMACNALWRGEVDTAVVGGTNVLTNPDMHAGLDAGHFLSRTGNCKTFDNNADGYCRGEAVVTCILKRQEDAVADRDPIQACILSIGTNHSAESESITRPHVGAQQALFQSVLAEAGVDPNTISYVEMHGTGTQAGDAGETASVLETLAPKKSASSRSAHQPLHIGAAKSNVGHGEAAAGVTSLAKVLLMMKHSTIPPHCGIKTQINDRLKDLSARNTFIANTPVPWPRPKGGVRRVLLNNFSAAGGNTALVLEDPPEELAPASGLDPRKHHVVAVSAKTPASLSNNLKNMMAWIIDVQRPGAQSLDCEILARLSHTTTSRRMHHPHRVMVFGSDLQQINAGLQKSLKLGDGSTRARNPPGYILAFTGQGSQFSGMGTEFYSHYSSFRTDIQRYDRLCLQLGFPRIQPLFERGDAYDTASPSTLQLVAVCLQMALYRLWVSFGVSPKAVVGHSLGEYAALYAAGVLSQVDVIHLTGSRAMLMEQHCRKGTHAMLAVKSSEAALADVLGPPGEDYEISCVNGKESVVVGGTQIQMDRIRPALTRNRSSHTRLEVPYAFHTSQVEPILSSLEDIARGMKFSAPRIPIISPACGRVLHDSSAFESDFLATHTRGSVKMLDALSQAKLEGILDGSIIGVEIGPAPVVTKMLKEVAGPSCETFASLRKGEDPWKLLTHALAKIHSAGGTIDWRAYHKDFPACQQCIELPAYSWDLKPYWIQYVNDWSLRKGDPPLRFSSAGLESSSIHKIVTEQLAKGGDELVVEADLTRKDLHPMVQGHKVYGVPLCTPSVYADVALTIGEYIKGVLEPNNPTLGVEVCQMNIQSALVANVDGKVQLLRTSTKVDREARMASCTFSSVNEGGMIIEQHSNCQIRLFDVEQRLPEVEKSAPDIRTRMDTIKSQSGSSGNTFRFSKSMIYKMIGQLADFDPNYRSLVDITLDNDALEAVGKISFKDVLKGGEFHTNPAYIDALSQLGGFVMNANEGVDLEKEVFVNHGWRSLQLFASIDPDTTYLSHVKMSEGDDKLWNGDITIFDGEKVVAVFGGVALQGVPKRLMQYIVGSASKRVSGGSTKCTAAGVKPASEAGASSVTTSTSKKAEATAHAPASSSLIASAMEILSEESGIAVADLSDDARFDDMGLDSLLSLVVSSRLRDQLDVEVTSSIFLDAGNVGSFKQVLKDIVGTVQHDADAPEAREEVLTGDEPVQSSEANKTLWNDALNLVSEESGIGKADLSDDVVFNDIGIDSLLSLVICSRLRDELDLDVPDRALFLECPTMGDLRRRITGSGQTSGSSESTSSSRDGAATPESDTKDGSDAKDFGSPGHGLSRIDSVISKKEVPIRPAWSIVLQGMPKRATRRLFLFPDGCGAATSYINIPQVLPNTAVIGFNSPFMKLVDVSSQGQGEHAGTEVLDYESLENTTHVPEVAVVDPAPFLMQMLNGTDEKRLHPNMTLVNIEPQIESGPIELTFQDGTKHTTDILIGDDGPVGLMRSHVLGANNPDTMPVFMNILSAVGHVPPQDAHKLLGSPYGEIESHHRFERCGDGAFLLSAYLDNFFTTLGSFYSDEDYDLSQFTRATTIEELAEKFGGFEGGEGIVKALSQFSGLRLIPEIEHPHASTYIKGFVAMIGNAAHTMTNFQQLGPGQELEDAMILAAVLRASVDRQGASAALQAYDEVRRPRVVQEANHGKLLGHLWTGIAEGVGLDPEKLRENFLHLKEQAEAFDMGAHKAEALSLMARKLQEQRVGGDGGQHEGMKWLDDLLGMKNEAQKIVAHAGL